MPRKPKLMLNICQKLSRGLAIPESSMREGAPQLASIDPLALRSVVTQAPLIARRAVENPIVTPAMVGPSLPELEVVGVFNPAVTRHGRHVAATSFNDG